MKTTSLNECSIGQCIVPTHNYKATRVSAPALPLTPILLFLRLLARLLAAARALATPAAVVVIIIAGRVKERVGFFASRGP